jgi:hypothetical protein
MLSRVRLSDRGEPLSAPEKTDPELSGAEQANVARSWPGSHLVSRRMKNGREALPGRGQWFVEWVSFD